MIYRKKTRNRQTHTELELMGNLNLQKSKKKSSTIGAFNSQKAEVKINLL